MGNWLNWIFGHKADKASSVKMWKGTAAGASFTIKQEELLVIPAKVQCSAIITSHDGRHAAYWETRGPHQYAPVIDGVAGRTLYNQFSPVCFTFSGGSNQAIYPAQRASDKKWVVVTSAGEVGCYDRVGNFPLVSPRPLSALLVSQNKEELVVVEGQPGKPYKKVMPGFSCLGAPQTVYFGKLNTRKWVAVVDGSEQQTFNQLWPFYPSPNLTHVAIPLDLEPKCQAMVIDGKQDQTFARVGPMIYSPDSQRMAYEAERDGQGFVILDGQELGPYKRAYTIWFSPDSQRVGCIVELPNSDGETRQHLVVDGEQGPGFGTMHGVTYSPDSRRLLYIATDLRTKQQQLVIDHQPGVFFDAVAAFGGSPVFSPDSRHFAAMVRVGNRWQLALDGAPVGESYDRFLGSLVFDSATTLHFNVQDFNEQHSRVYRVELTLD